MDFIGRVAIVTGAGGGLGRSYAWELAWRGAKVVVNDLGGSVDGTGASTKAADVVVEAITQAGGEAVANYESVATAAGGEAIVEAALESFGQVDIVINNAGILRDRSFANLTWEEIDGVVNTHLLGAFNVSQPAFRAMKEANYGRFVFTSSNAGLFGNFGQANYGAAKAGLVGLSNVIAIEGAKYGIQSNVIAPVARTRMTEQLLGPMAELVEPLQVTPMVVFLCSEQNPFTHEIFTAGGGRYGRIFIGTNNGWFAGRGVFPTVDHIASHLDEIRDISSYEIPLSSNEEIMIIGRALAAPPSGVIPDARRWVEVNISRDLFADQMEPGEEANEGFTHWVSLPDYLPNILKDPDLAQDLTPLLDELKKHPEISQAVHYDREVVAVTTSMASEDLRSLVAAFLQPHIAVDWQKADRRPFDLDGSTFAAGYPGPRTTIE
ncbi:MAG: SDR family oxidoreductase [Acidimicrobiia bacterium]|nr:SDR family oxidoreductase [Acidimicrobiia bacterium]